MTEACVEESREAVIRCNLGDRRPHDGDHRLWSRSGVDLGDSLEQARRSVPALKRLHDVAHLLPAPRPLVAHRHYNETGTLRTFDVALFDGTKPGMRQADGLVLEIGRAHV